MSRTVRLVTSLAALLLVTACSSSSDSPAGESRPSVAKGTATAAAVTLKPSDLPTGFKATPHLNGPDDFAAEKELASCLGVGAFDEGNVVRTVSDDFSQHGASEVKIYSVVTVTETSSVASARLSALKSDKAAPCFEAYAPVVESINSFATAGAKPGKAATAVLEPETGSTSGGYGYSIKIDVSFGATSFPGYLVVLGASKKHTDVRMIAISAGAELPVAQRDAIWKSVVQRLDKSAV